MTDIDQVRMMLRNAYGLSDEDIDRALTLMSDIALAQVLAQMPPLPEPKPQDFAGFVGERIGDAIRGISQIVTQTAREIGDERVRRDGT